MRNLNDIFCDTQRQCNLFDDPIMDSVKRRDYKTALEHLVQLLRAEINELPQLDRGVEVYRFVGFPPNKKGASALENEIIKDIEQGRMTVSNPMNFNDPMDPIIRVWAKEKKKKCKTRDEKMMYGLLSHAMDQFRMGCFAKTERGREPFYNTLMWGHYAKGHRGVCIKYFISERTLAWHTDEHHNLCLSDIRYRDRKIMSDYISFDNSLLAKGKSWEYENESRLIYFTDNLNEWLDADGKIKDYISLEGFDIASVYMGCEINNSYRAAIKEVARKRGFPLYQMEFEMADLTQLRAREIVVNNMFY